MIIGSLFIQYLLSIVILIIGAAQKHAFHKMIKLSKNSNFLMHKFKHKYFLLSSQNTELIRQQFLRNASWTISPIVMNSNQQLLPHETETRLFEDKLAGDPDKAVESIQVFFLNNLMKKLCITTWIC